MTTTDAVPTLLLIAIAAAIAPVLTEKSRWLRIPSVVIELVLGILMGPDVFNIAHPNGIVHSLADMGLAFLMFMAGFELNLQRLKGRPLNLAAATWLVSLAFGLGLAFALVSTSLAIDTLIIGLALTTTALGTLIPVLRDAGVLGTSFGDYVLGVGTIGEFGPIVAISVLLTRKDPVVVSLLLVAFVALAGSIALLAARARPPRFLALLRRHLHSSGQLPVRVAILLVLLLVYLDLKVGLDVLIGAFAAGIVGRQLIAGDDSEDVESKLQAIGFGFLIPIFFVVSGIDIDAHLFDRPNTLLRIALFVALMLLVRGVPVVIGYHRAVPRAQRLSLALFSATALPLIVVVTDIGTSIGRIRPENAAALVGAGIVSVLLFPAMGLRRLQKPIPSSGLDVGGAPDAAGDVKPIAEDADRRDGLSD